MRRGVAVALSLTLLVAGCGGGGGDRTSPRAPKSSPTGGGPPSAGASPPPVPRTPHGALDGLVEKCRRLDRELQPGRVVYAGTLQMVRGSSTTVRAAVTLDETTVPSRLRATGSTAAVPILVSCRVEARLAGDPDVFRISDTGWQPRSLLTSKTAEWYWFVSPRRGGNHALALDVRPVVRIEETGGRRRVSDIVASTETIDISVVVRVPPEEAAREGLDRTRGLLLAVSGVLTAIAAVAAGVLGLWRLRRRRETAAAGDPGDAPDVG